MQVFHCAQHGCVFEAESAPDNCAVCNNPFIEHPEYAALKEVAAKEAAAKEAAAKEAAAKAVESTIEVGHDQAE